MRNTFGKLDERAPRHTAMVSAAKLVVVMRAIVEILPAEGCHRLDAARVSVEEKPPERL